MTAAAEFTHRAVTVERITGPGYTWRCACDAAGGAYETQFDADVDAEDHIRGAAAETINRLDAGRLVTALRIGAGENLRQVAALNLLVSHGHWVTRSGLRQFMEGRWVWLVAHTGALTDVYLPDSKWVFVAYLDYQAAAEAGMRASSSEQSILRIAASMTSMDYKISLAAETLSLDRANGALVARAMRILLG